MKKNILIFNFIIILILTGCGIKGNEFNEYVSLKISGTSIVNGDSDVDPGTYVNVSYDLSELNIERDSSNNHIYAALILEDGDYESTEYDYNEDGCSFYIYEEDAGHSFKIVIPSLYRKIPIQGDYDQRYNLKAVKNSGVNIVLTFKVSDQAVFEVVSAPPLYFIPESEFQFRFSRNIDIDTFNDSNCLLVVDDLTDETADRTIEFINYNTIRIIPLEPLTDYDEVIIRFQPGIMSLQNEPIKGTTEYVFSRL